MTLLVEVPPVAVLALAELFPEKLRVACKSIPTTTATSDFFPYSLHTCIAITKCSPQPLQFMSSEGHLPLNTNSSHLTLLAPVFSPRPRPRLPIREVLVDHRPQSGSCNTADGVPYLGRLRREQWMSGLVADQIASGMRGRCTKARRMIAKSALRWRKDICERQ